MKYPTFKAEVRATLANGQHLEWALNDSDFAKLSAFIHACAINEPRIVHFIVKLQIPVEKDKRYDMR